MSQSIIQQFLDERRVEGALRENIEGLLPEHEPTLARLINELHPSGNTMREMLRLAREISVRDKQNLSEIFSESVLESLFRDGKLSTKEKQKKVRKYLEKKRYPEKSRLEDEALQLSRKIREKFGLHLQLPEDLEGDSIELQLSFRDGAQMKQFGERLVACADSEELSRVFQVLLGR